MAGHLSPQIPRYFTDLIPTCPRNKITGSCHPIIMHQDHYHDGDPQLHAMCINHITPMDSAYGSPMEKSKLHRSYLSPRSRIATV